MECADPDPLSALRTLAARYVLRCYQNRDLPRAADHALNNLVYSDALAELAGIAGEDPSREDVEPLFLQSLEELGLPLPPRAEAAWQLARDCMHRILNGDERPAAVLVLLRDVVWASEDVLPHTTYVGDGLDVAQLIGLYWSCLEPNERYYKVEDRIIEDEAKRLALLDSLARDEARAWLARHPA